LAVFVKALALGVVSDSEEFAFRLIETLKDLFVVWGH
jgi:uncharacterized protein (DUF2344 family)